MSKPKRSTPRDTARASEPKPRVDDVASLINERHRIDEWIAALDAKRDQTPPHVFTRVRGDYETRLRAVVERLASHTGSLAEEQAGLKKRLERIDAEIQHRKDERAEIELRANVGELDDAAVTKAFRDADAGLARLAADRSAIEMDLVRVTEFFAAASGGTVAGTPSAPRPSRASFDELSFLQSVVGEAGETKLPEPIRPAPSIEQIKKSKPAPPKAKEAAEPPLGPRRTGEMSSMVEPIPPEPAAQKKPAAAEPAVVPPPAPAEKAIATPAVKATENAPAVSQTKPEVAEPERPAGLAIEKDAEPLVEKPPQREPRLSIAMQQASMTIEPEDVPRNSIGVIKSGESAPSLLEGISSTAQAGEKPFAANVASNNPLSLKSAAKGDVKTLKCRECGAMNGPTEWYCEQCGAELSAV